MILIHAFSRSILVSVLFVFGGIHGSMLGAVAPPADVESAEKCVQRMQERLIDTVWARPDDRIEDDDGLRRQPEQFWTFGPTGRFRMRIERADATLDRGTFPEGFPDGAAMYEGDWRIRTDGLRLTNIRPVAQWQPVTRQKPDEDVSTEHAATVAIEWAGAGRNDRYRRVVIDGKHYDLVPRVGGVALRNLQQLERYLTHERFGAPVRRGSAGVRYWRLGDDGSFTAWVESEDENEPMTGAFPAGIPADATRLAGSWSITHDPPKDLNLMFSLNLNESNLVLTQVRVESHGEGAEQIVDEVSVPLGWVDGKLRIDIDGTIYMRRPAH